MKHPLLIIALSLTLFSCNKSGNIDKSKPNTRELPALGKDTLVSDAAFGEIIELKGTHHLTNQVFKINETQMIANDSLLIVKNRIDSCLFMVFRLPSFELVKTFGKVGQGPGEFQYVNLVKDESNTYNCYIHDIGNDKLFYVDKGFGIGEKLIKYPGKTNYYSDKQLYGINPNEFLYVESTKKGKAMYRTEIFEDTTITSQIMNLTFSKINTNWATFIGDFGVNGDKKRAVFAYKYFRRLLFMDTQNQITRILKFDQDEKTKKGKETDMLGPSNITYYWGISPQKHYVYLLYSGRTPITVSKELSNSPGYIYIEQYDWNGNPVHKYKLDHWGYFCINESENTIYLASVNEDEPFYTYQLPMN